LPIGLIKTGLEFLGVTLAHSVNLLGVELIDVAEDVPRATVLEVKSRGLRSIHQIGATRYHLLMLLLSRLSILHWSGGGRTVDAHCGNTIIDTLKFYYKDKEIK